MCANAKFACAHISFRFYQTSRDCAATKLARLFTDRLHNVREETKNDPLQSQNLPDYQLTFFPTNCFRVTPW